MKKTIWTTLITLMFSFGIISCGGGGDSQPQNMDLDLSGAQNEIWLMSCNPLAAVPGQNVQCYLTEAHFNQIQDCTLFVQMPNGGARLPMESSVLETRQSAEGTNLVSIQFQIPSQMTAGTADIVAGCGVQSVTLSAGYVIVGSSSGGTSGSGAGTTGGASGSSNIPVAGQTGSAGVSGVAGRAAGGSGGAAGIAGSGIGGSSGNGGVAGATAGVSGSSRDVPVRSGPIAGAGGASGIGGAAGRTASTGGTAGRSPIRFSGSYVDESLAAGLFGGRSGTTPTMTLTANFVSGHSDRINISWDASSFRGSLLDAYIYGFPVNGTDAATQCNGLILDPATGIAPHPMAPSYSTFLPYLNGELCRNEEYGVNCYGYFESRRALAEENYDKCRMHLVSGGVFRNSGMIQVPVRNPVERFTMIIVERTPEGTVRYNPVSMNPLRQPLGSISRPSLIINRDQPTMTLSFEVSNLRTAPVIQGCTSTEPALAAPNPSGSTSYRRTCAFTLEPITIDVGGAVQTLQANCSIETDDVSIVSGNLYRNATGDERICESYGADPSQCSASGYVQLTSKATQTCTTNVDSRTAVRVPWGLGLNLKYDNDSGESCNYYISGLSDSMSVSLISDDLGVSYQMTSRCRRNFSHHNYSLTVGNGPTMRRIAELDLPYRFSSSIALVPGSVPNHDWRYTFRANDTSEGDVSSCAWAGPFGVFCSLGDSWCRPSTSTRATCADGRLGCPDGVDDSRYGRSYYNYPMNSSMAGDACNHDSDDGISECRNYKDHFTAVFATNNISSIRVQCCHIGEGSEAAGTAACSGFMGLPAPSSYRGAYREYGPIAVAPNAASYTWNQELPGEKYLCKVIGTDPLGQSHEFQLPAYERPAGKCDGADSHEGLDPDDNDRNN